MKKTAASGNQLKQPAKVTNWIFRCSLSDSSILLHNGPHAQVRGERQPLLEMFNAALMFNCAEVLQELPKF